MLFDVVIEATVPARFKVLEPILNLPEVKVSAPLIVGEPFKVNPLALFRVRFVKVAPEIVLLAPVMVILPAPVCEPVPAILP